MTGERPRGPAFPGGCHEQVSSRATVKSGHEVSQGDLRAEGLLTVGLQQTAAAGTITTILSLPHSGATSLFGLAWALPL